MQLRPVLAVLGPTASAKSDVAFRIARRLDAIILSVDSMQVYRGMDVGTAKPPRAEREAVPHRMIDLVKPEEEYSVAEFQAEARRQIASADRPVVVAGGSGLHFRAVVDPLEFPPTDPGLRRELEHLPLEELCRELQGADPHARRHVDLDNPRRVVRAVEVLRLTGRTPSERMEGESARRVAEYEPCLELRAVGLDPGDRLAERVDRRLQRMRRAGLVEEVRGLAPRLGATASQAVGYKELLPVVRGEVDEEEGFARARAATLALARSQRTYFRRDPRISWLEWDEDVEALAGAAMARLEA